MRSILAVCAVLSAIFAPPWATIILMGMLSFRYQAWEVMFIGLLTDFLWLPNASDQFPLFTVAGFILVWGLEPLRKEFLFLR